MKLTVVYTTHIKAVLGIGSEEVELKPPRSSGELFAALSDRHGPAFRQLVLDGANRPLPSVLLCVGDEQVAAGESLTLSEGDVITLLGAISGG